MIIGKLNKTIVRFAKRVFLEGFVVYGIFGLLVAQVAQPIVRAASIPKVDRDAILGHWGEWVAPGRLCSGAAGSPSSTSLDLTKLSVKDKVAQLIMVRTDSLSIAKDVLNTHKVGGIYVAGEMTEQNNITSALSGNTTKPLVAVDEEGGQVTRLEGEGVPPLSSAKTLGTKTVEEIKSEVGERARAIASRGINMDLAPVLDLDNPNNPVIGQKERAFSSDPNTVSEKAGAFASALKENQIIPVFKHFPGHGNTTTDSHTSGINTTPDLNQLKQADLKPYETLLPQGGAVMLGHLDVPGLTSDNEPTSINKATVDLLRNDYKFNGLVITDDLSMAGVQERFSLVAAAEKAIIAGVDVLLFNDPSQTAAVITKLEEAVGAGRISAQRLDQAVGRIGAAKQGLGTATPTTGGDNCICQSTTTVSDPSLPNLTNTSDSGFNILSPAPFTGHPITPKAVVLHWTGGSPNATPEELVGIMKDRNVSVQLFIDGSGKVHQLVEDLATLTAHATKANNTAIGIEIAAGSDGTVATAAKEIMENQVQKQAVVQTVAYLMQAFNIPLEKTLSSYTGILSHHHVQPDNKDDVGDAYYQEIIAALKDGGQIVGGGSGCDTGAGGGGGDPEANKILGQEMAAKQGFMGNEWTCLLELWTRESSWNHNEQEPNSNNPTSSAYGIPQALVHLHKANIDENYPGYYDQEIPIEPGTPRETYDYSGGQPAPQIQWGLDYIKGRYQTPCQALEFHDAHDWY